MMTKSKKSEAAAMLGRIGGQSKSPKKIAAVNRNLKKALARRWPEKRS